MAPLRPEDQRSVSERYVDLLPIGAGGAAFVFRARDHEQNKDVAVKVLRLDVADRATRERFRREIRTLRAMAHPSILPILDDGVVTGGPLDGAPFYVMPFVSTGSLRDRITRDRQLGVPEATRIVCAVLDALSAAHERGIVHRDVKPENVLLDEGRVLVADFGIARALGSVDGVTSTSAPVVGTPRYMSPEQFAGDREVDARSDIYSVGVMLYELLAGAPPFTGTTAQALAARHLLEAPPPLGVVRPDVPRALVEVIGRALSKVPAARWASCGEFTRALEQVGSARDGGAAGLWRPALVLAGVVSLALVAWPLVSSAPLEEHDKVLVAPVSGLRDRDARFAEAQLRGSLRRWRGVSVVDPLEAADSTPVRTLEELGSRARRVHAEYAMRLEARSAGDLVQFEGALIDVNPAPVVVRRSAMAFPITDAGAGFQLLVDSLLVDREAIDAGSRDLGAARAFGTGMRAIRDWDLERAAAALDSATRLDADFGGAYLWLALVRTWMDRPVSSLGHLIARAEAAPRGSVRETDRVKLEALGLQRQGRLPAACKRWDEATKSAPSDFASWYGLATCLRDDDLVVVGRDGALRFRTSHARALEAYRHALEILPSTHRALRSRSFETVRRFMLTAMTDYIEGRAADGSQYAGVPSLDGEELVVVPVPMERLAYGEWSALPRMHFRAVLRQRALFDSLTATWVEAYPASSDAHLARAIARDMLRDQGSLSTMAKARRLAATPAETLATGGALVRLLARHGVARDTLTRHAAALADTLLRRFARDTLADSRVTVALAALLGRTGEVARILRSTAWRDQARSALDVESQILVVYAAAAVESDTLRSQARRVRQLIDASEPAKRDSWEAAALARAATMAFPRVWLVDREGMGQDDFLLEAQRLVRQGEGRQALHRLRLLVDARSGLAAESPIDAVCAEARTALAAGDTALARRWMGAGLRLDQAGPEALSDPVTAAMLGPCLLDAGALGGDGDRAYHAAYRWLTKAQDE